MQESNAVGGVIITASHNPQQWNALKFLQGDGLFLTAAQNREVRRQLRGRRPATSAWDQLGRRQRRDGRRPTGTWTPSAPCPGWTSTSIRSRDLHAVVDAVEGAGGSIVPRLLETSGRALHAAVLRNVAATFPTIPNRRRPT